jgi:hypothetical protein
VPFVLVGVGAFRQKADDGETENGAIDQAGVGFIPVLGLSPA